MNLFIKQKLTQRHRKKKVTKKEEEWRDKLGIWD